MSGAIYSAKRDLTASLRIAVPTGPLLMLAMCGHKTVRAGAEMRGRIVWRCAACALAKRGAA